VVVETLATEKQLATKKGFDYVRLPTLDHSRPSDEIVDAFLELIKKNPNAWFHVHCHVGKGRTTTFMTLYDMFYNAKEVEFDEILERQKEIDGEDFKKYLQKTNLESYMKNLYDERLKFLKRFYDFCKNSDPQHITWTEWLQQESQI
jgi:protein-tyrosine phosphatase